MGSVEDMQSCFSFNVWNFQAEHTRQKRKNLTQEHLDLLTEEYNKNHKPTKETFQRLTALIPGITEKSIKIWYQNRRSKLSMTKKRNQKKSEKVSASCIATPNTFSSFQVLSSEDLQESLKSENQSSPTGAILALGIKKNHFQNSVQQQNQEQQSVFNSHTRTTNWNQNNNVDEKEENEIKDRTEEKEEKEKTKQNETKQNMKIQFLLNVY